jgi:glycosyltransferase involved in cell wall biosynthesis
MGVRADANAAASRDEVARQSKGVVPQLAELTAQIADLRTHVDASQRRDIADNASELQTLKSELTSIRDVVAAAQTDKPAQKAMLERYHGLLHDLESTLRHVGELERELGEAREAARRADAYRREVDALKASSSWRITGPIRAVKLAARRLVGAKPNPPAHPLAPAPAPLPEPAPMLDAQPTPEAARRSRMDAPEANTPEQLAPLYVSFEPTPTPPAPPAVKAIAFYLPQFHPIPENDAWWGKGFTEWTNVTKASPQYAGHYQPHLPDELGFYDLRVPAVQERQAELAKIYGVSAFCFYFYWFAGKRLLETPILQWLHNPKITMPFCLCWANENWSRRWDGLDAELLIGQEHTPEDDIAFIAYVSQYLRDPRCVRINGKPLLLVYRPGLLPDPRATAQRWRQWCRDNGVGEIHLTLTQSFDMLDPHEYGFDAAVEFPPNNMGPPDITDRVEKLNPDFDGTIYDYDFYVDRSEQFPERPYTVFRGAFPSWDNEARRVGRGVSFLGATPEKFRRFVRNAASEALKAASPDERIIFINAWNEWAEGTHLEPDRRYGFAWLEALRGGLEDASMPRRVRHLTLVVHDAYRHGAQYLALNMARVFSRDLGFDLDIVILADGPLKPDFTAYGAVHDLAGVDPRGPRARQLAQALKAKGADHAICNTTVTGLFLKTLTEEGVECIALIHELPGVIAQYGLSDHLKAIWAHARRTIYPSTFVREKLAPPAGRPETVRTQGLYKRNGARKAEERAASRQRLRAHFNLPAHAEIVLCVAYGDRRKGIDLWAEIGRRVMQARKNAVFFWVGDIETSQRDGLAAAVSATGMAERFLFPGFQSQTDDFYAGADIFAMPSREDPFPTVIMESLDVGVPVVAFDGAGGFSDLLRSGVGVLAPMEDLEKFARGVVGLLADESARRSMGERGLEMVRTQYSFRRYCFDLARYLGADLDRVSVVVPNYNYASHLADRIDTVLNQGFPIYELIVLDDRSTDDSVAVAQRLLAHLDMDWSLHVNEHNSGSPCRQWLNGAARATGDFVWIAEADDLTLPGFLEVTLPAFHDRDVVMSYCQSQQMAGDGAILCPHYLDYVADIDAEKWRSNHIAGGRDEIRGVLAVKNTIPNVSACVFRRDALVGALQAHIEDIAQYRIAGDWATYVRVLERGKIAFSAQPLNLHRRHERSVTVGSFNEKLLREILSMQHAVHERFGATRRAEATARTYAQELYVQFGLASADAPQVFANPAFAAYWSAERLAAE